MSRSAAANISLFWKRVSLLFALAFVAFFVLSGTSRAETSWLGDYETGDFSQWSGVQALPGRATTVTDRVRHGTFAARYEVRPGDNPIGATGERSEVMKITGEQAGTESWWGWSTYFGNDFNPNLNTHWNIFTDWHHSGCCGQANVHFEIDTTTPTWGIQLRTFGGTVDQNERRFRLADFQRNTWYDFVFHVRWATDNTGFVEVWLNGQNVLPLTNTPTIYSGQTVYLKQGFYRGPGSDSSSVVYHDAMRRGTSAEDVSAPPVAPSEVVPPPAPTEPPLKVKLRKRPKLLTGKRIESRITTLSGSTVTVVVRTMRGRILGVSRRVANRYGYARVVTRMRRWRGQRFLRVSVGATRSGEWRRTRVSLALLRRELALPR